MSPAPFLQTLMQGLYHIEVTRYTQCASRLGFKVVSCANCAFLQWPVPLLSSMTIVSKIVESLQLPLTKYSLVLTFEEEVRHTNHLIQDLSPDGSNCGG